MSQSEPVIEIRNLSKIYRDFWGRPKVRALNSLSLDVRKGEVFGLLGPNGSGKTTTLKLLLGLLFPTEGEITILGKSAADVSPCAAQPEAALRTKPPSFAQAYSLLSPNQDRLCFWLQSDFVGMWWPTSKPPVLRDSVPE